MNAPSFDINEWITWCTFCDETTNFYNTIQSNQHIENRFNQLFGADAAPIPLNSYKKALTKVYLALGMDEKQVKDTLSLLIGQNYPGYLPVINMEHSFV